MQQNENIQFYTTNDTTHSKVNFQISVQCDPRQLSETGCFNKIFLSPYNPFFLAIFTKGSNSRQLFKFENGSFRELLNNAYCKNKKKKVNLYTYDCVFMKYGQEFIIAGDRELEFCRIEKDFEWKTIQIICSSYYSITLNQDEQTLYCKSSTFSVYQKAHKRNNNWQHIYQFKFGWSNVNSIGLNQHNIVCINGDSIFLLNLKNQKLKSMSKLQRKNQLSEILFFTKEGFILGQQWIIQLNQWKNKIMRRYSIGKIIDHYDPNSGLLALRTQEDLILCRFEKGQFKLEQTILQYQPLFTQIGNNGLLMICRDGNKLVFYE